MEKKRKGGIDRNIRQCLSYVIKHNGPFRWASIVGFTKEEFLNHMKENFDNDMTFENYGSEWVISFVIPGRCYNFQKISDEDFKKFWSLKNIIPRKLKDAQHQKKSISKKLLDKYKCWDILPTGNISHLLVD